MKEILNFIDLVHLVGTSPRAQVIWMRSFANMVNERLRQIESEAEIQEIEDKLMDGDVEKTEEFTAGEIAEAVKMLRDSRKGHLTERPWYAVTSR